MIRRKRVVNRLLIWNTSFSIFNLKTSLATLILNILQIAIDINTIYINKTSNKDINLNSNINYKKDYSTRSSILNMKNAQVQLKKHSI